MSLLDLFTGGASGNQEEAMKRAEGYFKDVNVPDAASLTLPELQKYVSAGLMTPAQAKAILMKGNAYDNIKTDSRPIEAEMSALSRMQDIAESGGLDQQAKAKIAEATNATNTQEQGQNGYILDQMAARGIPTSLLSAAMQSANAGQAAQTQSMSGQQAAADAEMRALQALESSGTLGGQIHAQQYGEEANKAAAKNAIDEWNAATGTNVNLSNAGREQEANAYNTTNAQGTSDKNTGLANTRTAYNANIPQQVFDNQMRKASGQSGAATNTGAMYGQQGQQEAGIYSGLINMGANGAAAALKPKAPMAAAEGGTVPGTPNVPGDSTQNDKVHALLSPGEVVVPRSIAPHPEMAKQFIQHVMRNKIPIKPVHHDDIKTVLEALTSRREAA